jgi:hypothetical protein
MPALLKRDGALFLTEIRFDEAYCVYFILDETGEPAPLDADSLIGEPFAFCRFDDIGKREIPFKSLRW